jgi:hypothetical protein
LSRDRKIFGEKVKVGLDEFLKKERISLQNLIGSFRSW